ncbi:hypothetical protein ABPG75_003367 [Micractinium tetrahymenae]
MAAAFRIPQPESIERARELAVGARVARYWHEPYCNWFEAKVLSVDDTLKVHPARPDDIPEPGAFYVLLRYPPQKGFGAEKEDVKWDLLFNSEDGEVLDLPGSARPHLPHFVPPGAAARSRQPPRVGTPHDGRPSSASPAAPGGSGKRNSMQAEGPAGGSGRTARRAKGGPGGKGGSARKRGLLDVEGVEGDSEPQPWQRPRQERHQRPEPAGSGSLVSGPADTAGAAGMLLWLHQGGAQPPRGGQQVGTLQTTPSQQWHGQPGGGRNSGAAYFTQHGGSQAGLAGAGGRGRPSGRGGRGGGGGSDSDGDYQEAQPSQRRRGRPPRQQADYSSVPDPEGAPGAGNLKRIEVTDFMCHHHLALELGPHVNLISGDNGSGKSALLVALQCCLGARAADTGRFRSMAGFVREEATQATVKVTLWNTGAEAFRRAELGPELTVVRKINLPSGGSHEIQDCKGRTVLRGFAAVQELMDALGINCSNPAIVLTQEMAKTFANQQSEAAKFDGFMEATEFQKIVEHLSHSAGNIKEVDALAKELQADVKRLAEQEKALEAQLQQMQEITAWQRNYEDLEKCVVWGSVYAAERIIAMQRDKLENTAPAEAASRQARIDSFAQQIAALNAKLQDKERFTAQAQADLEGREAEEHSLRGGIKAKRREVAQLAGQLEEQRREVEELEARARELEAANADVTAEFVQSTQQQVDAYKQRVATCRDQCERATVAASNARQHLAECEAAQEQAQAGELSASRTLAKEQRQVAVLEADLRRLEAAQAAPLAKFGGQGAVELHRAVQHAVAQGRFSRPPIHIGSSLSVADSRWAAAVDVALGPLLGGWIVHSGEDRALLQTLRRRLAQPLDRLTVVVTSFDTPLHTIPPARLPSADRLTVMSMLRFAEGPHCHVLKNVLIDQAAIERKILTDTQAEAIALARDASSWNRYRMSTAVAADGSSAYRRKATETALPPPRHLRPRLVQDISQQVADCRAELQQAQAALVQLQQEVQQKHEAVLEAQRDVAAAKRQLQAAVQHRQTCDTQYAEARSHQPLVLDAADAGGSEAAQRVAELRGRAADAEARAGAAEDALKAAEQELGRLQERHKEAHGVPQHLTDAINDAAAAVQELAAERQALQRELNAALAEKVAHEEKMAEERRQLEERERALAGVLEDAEAVCTREEEAAARQRMVADWRARGKGEEEVARLLGCRSMQRQAEALERKINRRTADAGIALEDLENEHAQVRNKRWKLDCRWDRSEKLLAVFHKGWSVRKAKFRELRASIATNVSKAFGQYLHYREHRGFVQVDYHAGRLALAVGPGGKEPTSNMGSLSGGERSISSLAFILALGKEVNPPFHAMDEFDVFMDSVNRRFALQFLLEFAWRHHDRQLLLLTPQDIAVLEEARQGVEGRLGRQLPDGRLPDDFIKVVRMPAPRGRQQPPAPPLQQD